MAELGGFAYSIVTNGITAGRCKLYCCFLATIIRTFSNSIAGSRQRNRKLVSCKVVTFCAMLKRKFF